MSDKQNNNGGPAFPAATNSSYYAGMTLRDWFAGQMAPAMFRQLCENGEMGNTLMLELCEDAYFYADTMLKAREAKS